MIVSSAPEVHVQKGKRRQFDRGAKDLFSEGDPLAKDVIAASLAKDGFGRLGGSWRREETRCLGRHFCILNHSKTPLSLCCFLALLERYLDR